MTYRIADQTQTWGGNVWANCCCDAMVGCSNTGCFQRNDCWARKKARRIGARLKCQNCIDFTPHTHFERIWNLPTKPNLRVALNFGGDMFDRVYGDNEILRCFNQLRHRSAASWHSGQHSPVFLIQTRRVDRLIEMIADIDAEIDPHRRGTLAELCQFGTTFNTIGQEKQVRALGRLPDAVKRFLACEPSPASHSVLYLSKPWWEAILAARPDWAYYGPLNTPRAREEFQKSIDYPNGLLALEDRLREIGCPLVWKPSAGEALFSRNQEVTLP